MEHVATIKLDGRLYEICFDGEKLLVNIGNGKYEPVDDGEFYTTPSVREIRQRIYALYSFDGFEVVDCIGQ